MVLHPLMFFIHSSDPVIFVLCGHGFIELHHMKLICINETTTKPCTNTRKLHFYTTHCIIVVGFSICEHCAHHTHFWVVKCGLVHNSAITRCVVFLLIFVFIRMSVVFGGFIIIHSLIIFCNSLFILRRHICRIICPFYDDFSSNFFFILICINKLSVRNADFSRLHFYVVVHTA